MIHQIPLDESSVLVNGESVKILNPLATLIVEAHLRGTTNSQISSDLSNVLTLDPVEARATVSNTITQATESSSQPYFEVPEFRNLSYQTYRTLKNPVEYLTELAELSFRIRCENRAVASLLHTLLPRSDTRNKSDDLLEKSANGAESNTHCEIAVYEEQNETGTIYPIVVDGITADQGIDIPNTAMAVLSAIWGMSTAHQEWMVLAHAGAVAKNDNALLLPAESGSGKSTLVAYLMSQGFKLLADDCVPLLRPSSQLQPIAKCVSIKEGSWSVLSENFPQLKGANVYLRDGKKIKYLLPAKHQIQPKPVRCVAVVIPAYTPEVASAKLQTIQRAEILAHLLNGSSKIKTPASVASITEIVNWLHSVNCYSLAYSSLPDAEIVLDNLISSYKV